MPLLCSCIQITLQNPPQRLVLEPGSEGLGPWLVTSASQCNINNLGSSSEASVSRGRMHSGNPQQPRDNKPGLRVRSDSRLYHKGENAHAKRSTRYVVHDHAI